MPRHHFFPVLLLALLAAACGRADSDKAAPQPIAPVYSYFGAYDGSPVPDSLRAGVEAFMKVTGAPSAADSLLAARAASAAVRVFTPDVDSVYRSLVPLESSLGSILDHAAAEGLELPRRSYAAVVWGRPESIVFCDSVMLIALNHYLGADYPGYSHLARYAAAAKTPARLPLDMAEALAGSACPYRGGDEATVLSRLLYEGAMAEARMRLAGVGEAEALGYDDATYAELCAHESEMWRKLVASRLLYSTLPADAERLVAPAPGTPMLAAQAPGRAGRFIGHRIVRAYLDRHPDATLPQMLAPEFYASDATLRVSGYTGGK